MDRSPTSCARHPDVTTRLRCVACATPICPDCGREAAVGFKCPDCAAPDAGATSRRDGGGLRDRLGAASAARPTPTRSAGPVPPALLTRAVLAGIVASALGGLVLGPVLQGGLFLLLGSGVVGWGVARAVYWATGEVNAPSIQGIAFVAAGVSVAVGTVVGTTFIGGAARELALLAYPAAMYGGWIVVRQR
ncbi:MAG: hypothetical protein JJT89_13425 [Nitriliruptoraceae bacterium]|nr:hypothetical protein [Nitriliruptoraceae bacterium]